MSLLSLVLGLAPAVLLIALLAAGRYPGERALGRAIARRSARIATGQPPVCGPVVRPRAIRRPGLLIAEALGGRAPPDALAFRQRIRLQRRQRMRLKTAIATTGIGALAFATSASAHVTVTPTEAPADGYAVLEFAVPHGCDGSATNELRVQIPETVPTATPQVHPGWELTTKEGPKDEVELHGETITEGVSEVVWTADQAPLPDGYLDVFAIQVKLPPTEGEQLAFPAIQKCEKGETRWIQVPQEGESEEDLDAPAPLVTLGAAEAAHGASTEHEDDAAPEETTAEGDDDSGSDGLAIAGIGIGALGLLTGGTALARSGRRSG